VWLLPFGVLASISLALLLTSFWADAARYDKAAPGLWALLTHPERDEASAVLGNVGQVVTQILGVAISVVAIIVELAATRYTHRITELFFKAPANFAVMGLFVIAGLDGLWISLLFRDSFLPVVGTLLSMGLMSVSVLLLLPYFAFVFQFLNPMNIVGRIRAEALEGITHAPRSGTQTSDAAAHGQFLAADGTDQLADVALNAMQNHDGAIAMASVNALGDLARDYLQVKERLPLDWFRVTEAMVQDPDFVSMSREVREALGNERTWFEFKVLRQFQTIYQSGLNAHREVCYVVSIHTRELAESAMARGDDPVAELCIKFFNTYLRATVNAKDVRTAYNVLNQYRLLADAALERRAGRYAVEVARYFKYYGQLAFQSDLGFILETAAYDLCALNEHAFNLHAPERGELLKIFLQVDKEGEGAAREKSLRGVRKAQIKLATYYLQHDDEAAAREVFQDMRDELPARLASIRDELLAVESSTFWEITDRGTNFDYLPQARKDQLYRFFAWFGGTLPEPRLSLPRVDGPRGRTGPHQAVPSDPPVSPAEGKDPNERAAE
jgi:hypothetical protein